MSLTTPYFEQFLLADGVTTVFSFGTGFDALSANYVKCQVYNEDGSVIVPDFTVDMAVGSITIVSLTTPDGQILNAPLAGSIVRVYRDVPETQEVTVQALKTSTAQQIVNSFNNIVAMIQELQYAHEHFTVHSTLPQRDLQIQLLDESADKKLVYWDNIERKLVVTEYGQDEVVISANIRKFKTENGVLYFFDGVEWLPAVSQTDVDSIIEDVKGTFYTKTEIDNKVAVINTATDANADAIQKTREDFIEADSEIHQILNAHASELTTQRNDIDGLGDQVSAIEEKIPETASVENPLVTRSEISSVYKFKGSVATYDDLPTGATVGDVYNVTDTGANYAWDGSAWDKLSETVDLSSYATTAYVNAREQDVRDDYMNADADLQTQINGQATAISTNTSNITALTTRVGTNETNIALLDSDVSTINTDVATAKTDIANLKSSVNSQAGLIQGLQDDVSGKVDKNQGTANAGKILSVGSDGQVTLTSAPGGGLTAVTHDSSLTGAGTDESPLGIASTVLAEIADKAEQTTVETLSGVVSQNTTNIGTLRTDVDDLGDQVSGIESKIPESTSTTNQLVNATQLSEAIAEFEALPDQTGNVGKFLKTDGTTASWEDVPPSVTITLKEYDE